MSQLNTVEALYQHSCIEEIIIYDKFNIKGLLRFKNKNIWHEFKNNTNQSLLRLIIHNINRYVPYMNQYDILISDIVAKCYTEKQPYQIKYHEYINVDSYNDGYLVNFNNKTKLLIPVDYHISSVNKMIIKDIENINLPFIYKLMNQYVEPSHLLKFKKLCHSVFVKNNNICFHDCYWSHIYPLYQLLKDLCFKLYGPESYYEIYYGNFKTLKDYKNTRVLFIYLTDIFTMNDVIYLNQSDSFKNKNKIIITHDQTAENIYHLNALEPYNPNNINTPIKYSQIKLIFENQNYLNYDLLWWSISDYGIHYWLINQLPIISDIRYIMLGFFIKADLI